MKSRSFSIEPLGALLAIPLAILALGFLTSGAQYRTVCGNAHGGTTHTAWKFSLIAWGAGLAEPIGCAHETYVQYLAAKVPIFGHELAHAAGGPSYSDLQTPR